MTASARWASAWRATSTPIASESLDGRPAASTWYRYLPFQGVLSLPATPGALSFRAHMLFDGQAGRSWEDDAVRESQLVFIGRDLDRAELADGLRACLA